MNKDFIYNFHKKWQLCLDDGRDAWITQKNGRFEF